MTNAIRKCVVERTRDVTGSQKIVRGRE